MAGQLLYLLKPVDGRPDAPRAWYEELCRALQKEFGFERNSVDPAMFSLTDGNAVLRGIMIVHVDDVMMCDDGSVLGKEVEKKLYNRFQFGTWQRVAEQTSGVSYCGKEIRVARDESRKSLFPKSNRVELVFWNLCGPWCLPLW